MGIWNLGWSPVALDAHTKIIPVIHVGRRKREDAMRFVHEIWQRLSTGMPQAFFCIGRDEWMWGKLRRWNSLESLFQCGILQMRSFTHQLRQEAGG